MAEEQIQAIFFDLLGTLGYVRRPPRAEEFCEYLQSKGYRVYPQAFAAARNFVAMVDYPKRGYSSFDDFYAEILRKLNLTVAPGVLHALRESFAKREQLRPFPDSEQALMVAKAHRMKTAIVTTTPRFRFENLLAKLGGHVDLVMDGFQARCEKSNPAMYLKALRSLRVLPQDAAMIGDEIQLDIILPKKLGMKAILLARGEAAESSSEADGVAHSLLHAVDLALSLVRSRHVYSRKIRF